MEDEVVYKLGPKAEAAETGMEDYSDLAVSGAATSISLGSRTQLRGTLERCGPFRLGLSGSPFNKIHDKLAELQTRYYRMEHITRGANRLSTSADSITFFGSWQRRQIGRRSTN